MRKVTSMLTSIVMLLSLLAFAIQPSKVAATSLSVNGNYEAAIGPVLKEKMGLTIQPLEVIVTFHKDGGPGQAEFDLLNSLGITTGIGFQSLPIAGVLATPDQIEELAKNPKVRSIYFNSELQYENYESTHLTGAKKVLRDDAFRKANGGLPVSGKDVTVLVNDTGIDGTHKDLKFGPKVIQNVAAQTNLNGIVSGLIPITYTEDVPNTDTGGHGTHVGGIVGGTGDMSGGTHEGVAPGVNLIGYGSGAALFILDTLGGFDYALTHSEKYNIRVITNSFGSTGDVGTDFDPNHPTNVATKALYDNDIVVVFSAGNSGPAESTMTGNFKKAPWVISVAAGDKFGRLAEFSSRGVEGKGGTVVVDGKTYTWEDRPTVTAPGVDIISTRAWDVLSPLGLEADIAAMKPGEVPYYTMNSGTSMSAPHVAGVVALMLDANPNLKPDDVKAILQKTATNMPGEKAWEVGAGYVNAYAAVDASFNREKEYGKTLKMNRDFNGSVNLDVQREDITIDFTPGVESYKPFEVEEGLTELAVTVYGKGVEETGNPINLVLVDPDGEEYSSGISLLFALYYDRTVIVNSPKAGTWKIEIRGLRGNTLNPMGIAAPEQVEGVVTTKKENGYTGLDDINGHNAKDDILVAVYNQLVDSYADGNFKPNLYLTKYELAEYLLLGGAIRQTLPDNIVAYDKWLPYTSAVLAKGGALKDWKQMQNAVMMEDAFSYRSYKYVTRSELAYSVVQTLGLQEEAGTIATEEITVPYKDTRIVIEDADQIPEHLRGHVQVALDKQLLNAYFKVELVMNEYTLEPEVKITATFAPSKNVTRADYAVAANRMYNAYMTLER
ncbi:S8 family serine peptidase [Lottiidibacillus patelloidae]|uniref:S8 family serine peptidase n=1 Tax=Lottiidibacillus patelloidae TaxID=2670334 RepID=UPI001303E703|nr:S8 family serine peptidase [Lottiidibacillus patelloidae]